MEKMIAAFGLLFLLVLLECIRENYTFRVTHYTIRSPKLCALQRERRVVMLSDLHNCSYGEGNCKLIKAIRKQKPDLILIAGDMLVGKKGTSARIAEELVCTLAKEYPVYYANGNHEQRMKECPEYYGSVYREYKETLENSGVHFLENKTVKLDWEGQLIGIYGLEIPAYCYEKFRKIDLPVEEIKKCIGMAGKEEYTILLAHNPVFAATYLTWGADLILSGHLHGGLVRIPFLGGMITPQANIFPKYSGELTEEGNQSVVVSKGLGSHTIRLRFLNMPELIVLHMGGGTEA